MGARYTVKKHSASGDFVIWDTSKGAPVGQERMRREQADELARFMNADCACEAREPELDEVQAEIARRVGGELEDFHASEAHDSGAKPLSESELLALKEQVDKDVADLK